MIEQLGRIPAHQGCRIRDLGCYFRYRIAGRAPGRLVSRPFPEADIVAVECNRETLEKCRRNIAQKPRITLVDKAINSYTGRCTFYPIDPARTVTTWKDGNPGRQLSFCRHRRRPR